MNQKTLFKLKIRMFLFLFSFIFVACQSTSSKPEAGLESKPITSSAINEKLKYTYDQLAVKDLDQLNAMALEQLRISKSLETDPEPLRSAVVFIFSRPNEDGALEKVLSVIKSPLDDQDLWNPTLEELAAKSIHSLKDPQGLSGKEQVTYSIILMNIMSELKPDLKKKGFELELVKQIANSNIKLSKECRAEISLGQMRNQMSPSAVAQQLVRPYVDIQK